MITRPIERDGGPIAFLVSPKGVVVATSLGDITIGAGSELHLAGRIRYLDIVFGECAGEAPVLVRWDHISRIFYCSALYLACL
jgi:hypothetical protein